MSGGYNNTMMKCHLQTDVTLDDAIVVRVYARATDYAYTSRNQEGMAMQVSYTALKLCDISIFIVGNYAQYQQLCHNGVTRRS